MLPATLEEVNQKPRTGLPSKRGVKILHEMNESKEIWKPVRGFEDKYEVSSEGRVRRLPFTHTYKSGKTRLYAIAFLKGSTDCFGYKVFSLRRGRDFKKDWRLHRLLAEHFIPNPNGYKTIDHINGDKLDNRLENLRWCTRGQNMSWAFNEQGLIDRKGENHKANKLTENDVRKIKNLREEGWTHQAIADKIGKVGRRHITDILNGKCWEWMD